MQTMASMSPRKGMLTVILSMHDMWMEALCMMTTLTDMNISLQGLYMCLHIWLDVVCRARRSEKHKFVWASTATSGCWQWRCSWRGLRGKWKHIRCWSSRRWCTCDDCHTWTCCLIQMQRFAIPTLSRFLMRLILQMLSNAVFVLTTFAGYMATWTL